MPTGRRPPGRPRRIDLAEPTDVGILRAAAQLFMEYGYRGVTMEMVADAAGLTKAAVYYHFHDKASLVVAAMQRTFAAAQTATHAILAQPKPLTERMEELARVVLGLPQPFVAFGALMHEAQAELTQGQITALREAEASVTQPLEETILQAVAAGEIHADDPLLLAHGFVAALGVGQDCTPAGLPLFPDRERTARALVSLFWRGIDHS